MDTPGEIKQPTIFTRVSFVIKRSYKSGTDRPKARKCCLSVRNDAYSYLSCQWVQQREMLSWRMWLDVGEGGGAAFSVTTRKNQLVWCNPQVVKSSWRDAVACPGVLENEDLEMCRCQQPRQLRC